MGAVSVYSEERLSESCCASAFGITAGLGYNLRTKICSGGRRGARVEQTHGSGGRDGPGHGRRADELAGRASQARELLAAQPEVSDELKRKIEAARRIDEWRRGCIPLGERLDERCRPLVQPKMFTLIAADGSQIYPDRHGIASYYLLNTGAIVLRRGPGKRPL